MELIVREAVEADGETCARLCFGAFKAVSERHGFESPFPSEQAALARVYNAIRDAETYGIVAEQDGAVVGFNFLSEHDDVRGLGPIVVDPSAQTCGIGRTLMMAAIERARGQPIRLIQDSFNLQSLSLYASVGFAPAEPLVVMTGRPIAKNVTGYETRLMTQGDISECETLHIEVHGFSRGNELRRRFLPGTSLVATERGVIVAYIVAPGNWLVSHGVARDDDAMKAVVIESAVIGDAPVSFVLPTRRAGLLRWCLDQKFRALRPMTLMCIGDFAPPVGCWFPSVLY